MIKGPKSLQLLAIADCKKRFSYKEKILTVKKGFLVLIALFLLVGLSAQKGWEIGGWAGGSMYFGDLNTDFNLSTPGFGGGIMFRRNFNDRLCLKASGNYVFLRADDANSDNIFERARNLSFQSNVLDFTTQFEFNFLPYVHGDPEHFFTPYVYAGITVFSFNPKTEFNGELVELRPLGTEGQFKGEEYFAVQGGFAYGIGLKLDLNERWSLNFDLNGRYLFTDYLDDVSTVYPDKRQLLRSRGELAVALSDRSILLPGVEEQIGDPGKQRGNRSNNDAFMTLGIGIVRYFGNLPCPEYSRK